MFKSLLFIVFIIVFAIYFISIKIRQYPKNQDDPNIKLRRIESACGIINIATFAILLSSSSLYAFKVPEIIVKGIAIFAVCTVIFSLCLILLIQKLIQKLPIDETDNTFRHRLHLWGQNMLKLFSEKIRSIIPAGKKRVVPQQQSTEEHSVVTDSNTKIKNNDETSNIFIAIIFIVTLFLFATTFYIINYCERTITMLSTIYALLCIIVPCSLYQLIICKRQNKKQENKAIHFVWVYIFLLYIYLTFSVAGIGSIWDIGHYDTIIRLEEINLLPFQSEGIMTYVLNIIMFLPLGFLIPLIWKRYRNPLKIFMIGFGFSLSIELCQLFNRRNTDIDDLMMNTLGAVIGYFIWKLTKRLFKNINHKSISLSKLEPIVYLTLAVLGEFLLFNWRIFL